MKEYLIIVLIGILWIILGYLPLYLQKIAKTVIVAFGAYIVRKFTLNVFERVYHKFETKSAKPIRSMTRSLINLFIMLGAMSFILPIWGVSTKNVLASVGLISLAVGFALKDPLENVFSGLTLSLDPPFRVGDRVRVGGTEGVVEEVGLRYVRIRSTSGVVNYIPIKSLLSTTIVNYGKYEYLITGKNKTRLTGWVVKEYDGEYYHLERYCKNLEEAEELAKSVEDPKIVKI